MSEYVHSPYLIVIATAGRWTMTKASSVDDYTLWDGGDPRAWGGKELITKCFNRRKDEMAKKKDEAATQTAPAVPTTTIDIRIAQYVKMRDMIKKLDEEHKEKMQPYREALDKLNNFLLDHLQTNKVDSMKTEFGTVYKTSRKSASLEDANAFMRHVIGSEAWELLDRKANATAVEDYVKENGVLPPGVKYTVMHTVGVRKA